MLIPEMPPANKKKSDLRDVRTRRKCIDVSLKAIAGPGETSKLNLLRSISNVIQQNSSVVAGPSMLGEASAASVAEDTPQAGVNTDVDPAEDALVFSCWLLALLMGVTGSQQLWNTNVDLQTKILQTISVKNPDYFHIIMDGFPYIGYDAVLINSRKVTSSGLSPHTSSHVGATNFPSVTFIPYEMNANVRKKTNNVGGTAITSEALPRARVYRPMRAVLSCLHKDTKQPTVDLACHSTREDVLATVLEVLSRVCPYLPLHASDDALNVTFRLAAMSLLSSGGRRALQHRTLALLTRLLTHAELPCQGGVQLLVVQAVVVGVREVGCGVTTVRECDAAQGPAVQAELCSVVSCLTSVLPGLQPSTFRHLYQEMMTLLLRQGVMAAMQARLREQCLQLLCVLHHHHEPRRLDVLLTLAVDNMTVPEVILGLLPRLVVLELQRTLPGSQAGDGAGAAASGGTAGDGSGGGAATLTSRAAQDKTSNKRSYSESNTDTDVRGSSSAAVRAMECSRVWRLTVRQLQAVLTEWCGCTYPTSSFTSCLALVRAHLTAAARLRAALPAEQYLEVYSGAVLLQLSELLYNKLYTARDTEQIMELLQVLYLLVWFVNVIEGDAYSLCCAPRDAATFCHDTVQPSKRSRLSSPRSARSSPVKTGPHTFHPTGAGDVPPPLSGAYKQYSLLVQHLWLAIASLPWLSLETDWLDLKLENSETFLNWSKRVEWCQEPRLMRCCLSILCVAGRGIAPLWRAHLVQRAVATAATDATASLSVVMARHLPILMHNLGPAEGGALCHRLLPILTVGPSHSRAAVARAYRHLPCALLGITTLRMKSGQSVPCSEVLQCSVCDVPTVRSARFGKERTGSHNQDASSASTKQDTYSDDVDAKSHPQITFALMVPTTSSQHKLDNELFLPFYRMLFQTDNNKNDPSFDSSDINSSAMEEFGEDLDPELCVCLLHSLPGVVHHGRVTSLVQVRLLRLLLHRSLLVQTAAADALPLLVMTRLADDDKAGVDDMSFRLLLQLVVHVCLNEEVVKETRVQTGITLAVRQLVQLSTPRTCVATLLSLLHCLSLINHRHLVAEAHLAVPALAARLGLTPRQLLHTNRQIVCKVLVERATEEGLEMLLCHAAEVFRDPEHEGVRRYCDSSTMDVGDFTSSNFRHLLPGLVCRAAREGKPGLVTVLLRCVQRMDDTQQEEEEAAPAGDVATQRLNMNSGVAIDKTATSLLIDNFQHILVYAAFMYPVPVLELCIRFVADATERHPVRIQHCCLQHEVNELVLGLHSFRQRALQELECLSLLDGPDALEEQVALSHIQELHAQIRRRPASMTAVRPFLTRRFLGALVFLDGKLVAESTMAHERQQAVWAISATVQVVGRAGVSAVARKLLATLKLALDHTPVSEWKRCAVAWREFIFHLDPGLLGSLVEEILVTVSPALAHFPLTLGPAVNRLLFRFPHLRPCVALHLHGALPDRQQFKWINLALQEQQQEQAQHGVSLSLIAASLSSCCASLRHECCAVRLQGLRRALHLLHTHHVAVCAMALRTDQHHQVLLQLAVLLIGQCRDPEPALQVPVAEALGLLGAIDPTRLIRAAHQHETVSSKVHLSLDSPGFVRDLVLELARAFLAATDSNIQTCASFAMQELLRIHSIGAASTAAESTLLGSEVWSQLPSTVQELLQPLYKSRYIVNGVRGAVQRTHVAADAPWRPVYGTQHAVTFKTWIITWMTHLLDLVEKETDFEVFNACKPIFRRDTHTALHILPSLVMSVLLHSPHHHAKVATEVLAVTAEALQQGGGGRQQESPPHIAHRELQQLCVETVFSVLDAITVWVQQCWAREAGSKKHRTAFVPSNQLQQMLDFLSVLPSEQLARTAFMCQAYTRALLHIEEHVRSRPASLMANLTFMQQIYNALDEPDGVKGIAVMRTTDPSVHDSILLYKAKGRIHDALGCYEYLCSIKNSQASAVSVTAVAGAACTAGGSSSVAPCSEGVCGGVLEEDPHVGLLQCYISLDQPQAVLDITQAIIVKSPREEARLNEYRMEAAWRLFRWDDLESMLRCRTPPAPPSTWGEGVGEVLVSGRQGRVSRYLAGLAQLRRQIIPLIAAATMEEGAYQRAYPYILKLHILSELEDMFTGFLQVMGSKRRDYSSSSISGGGVQLQLQPLPLSIDELVHKWDDRLQIIQTSYKNLEPVLSFRRTLLMLACNLFEGDTVVRERLQLEVQRCWLHSAKMERKAGMLQQGETAFLHAGSGRDVFMERAKWLQVKGDHIASLEVLQRGIQNHFPHVASYRNDSNPLTKPERASCARAQLLLARYSEEAAILDVNSLMVLYRDACDCNKQAEDGHFHYAMYLDRILNSRREKSVEYRYHIVVSLSKALANGNKHLYESLPRMFTIWLELGTQVAQLENNAKKSPTVQLNAIREKLQQMNTLIGGTQDTLCLYQLMTALPQLISRICHSHPGVFRQISSIIATLLAAYPQQAIWHMVAVSKSSYNVRVQRCLETFEAAKKKRPGINKLINDFTKLADRFIELSNKPVEKGVSSISVNTLVRSLPRLLSEHGFSEVLIPTQQQMTVQLPAEQREGDQPGLDGRHHPFPSTEVYIIGVEDQVEVMESLQKPKKILLKGSDGNSYIVMCKPKDDLRKDCRLMDFTRFVNRLLARDPDARRRDLLIRTYGVVPLNEECGLLEWVHNLNGLRNILHKIYRERGIYMPASELKMHMCKQDVSIETKLDVFLNKLKARHPPVLGEWFRRSFPHPYTWYHARRSYCHTAGVMSMVGYVLGLGDRHGENINIDAKTGDVVHVDFNCLFNKGETFDWPERVPFRLTHNMVEAMGHGAIHGLFHAACLAMGHGAIHGLFHAACLITMRIMRTEREALMSVLTPFIHDPLVEWSRGDKQAKNTGEINNEKAQHHVRDIELRLKGLIASKARGFNIPLSVEGQVSLLISDASSDRNLCQMYIGWAPYL